MIAFPSFFLLIALMGLLDQAYDVVAVGVMLAGVFVLISFAEA